MNTVETERFIFNWRMKNLVMLLKSNIIRFSMRKSRLRAGDKETHILDIHCGPVTPYRLSGSSTRKTEALVERE